MVSRNSTVTLCPKAVSRGISRCTGENITFSLWSTRVTTSSNSSSTRLPLKFSVLGAGLLPMNIGGSISTGPPVGEPIDAHE